MAPRRTCKLPAVCLRLLGEIELRRNADRLELPPSKKTRALLAYLVVTQRPQRRSRLCTMFWDVADDPRAALRWSLSKLRPLVDQPGVARIVTTGNAVSFEPMGARVDLLAVREQVGADPDALGTEQLVQLESEFRGEFLEGLDLPGFFEFQAWCVAMREETRALHARILRALIERLAERPQEALPHARTLSQIDPLNEHAHVTLVRLLAASERPYEAEQQFEAAIRLLSDLGSGAGEQLHDAWQQMKRKGVSAAVESAGVTTRSADPEPAPIAIAQVAPPIVGRRSEWQQLVATVDDTMTTRRLHAVLLTGEPGIGKTRLLAELIADVQRRGGTVLEGCAYEAEVGRPYGPWVDALRRVPAVLIGETLAADLAPLLPGLGTHGEQRSRERLFGGVVELIGARAHSAPPVLVTLDDAQWCDGASAELLHYVGRMNRHRPVFLALAAREGELPDNEPMMRLLRSLRRDGMLEQIGLCPLSPHETEELVRALAPTSDAERVFAESAGNPLFAIEVARSLPYREDSVPTTLRSLVADRIERLPPDAADVLRWAAVVGQTFQVRRLSELTPIDVDHLVAALAVVERHGLLRGVSDAVHGGGAYAFAHDVVRQAVYGELSEPRRRLMHLRIARALESLDDGDAVAADLVYHAALAGEADLAARACLRAGRRCLTLFASTEADAMARRGMQYAQQLSEPARVKLLLELSEVRYAAQRPRDREQATRAVEELAQQALDLGCVEHARLGFHILSYLRWESGDWSDAQRQMMRAEEVSRSAGEHERAVALAEAARCLTLLDRDLGHAEALLLEAGALSARLAMEPTAIPDAAGMLRLHEGQLDTAAERFGHARDLCRREQDRLGEFRALEHLAMLEIQRGEFTEAQRLSNELVRIAERLREGSEAPMARALLALCQYALATETAPVLDAALAELRAADAKQRLSYVLRVAAEVDVRGGNGSRARERAEEALHLACMLERPSDSVLARVVLARAAALQGDATTVQNQFASLGRDALRGVSAQAHAAVERLRGEFDGERR